MTVAVEHLDTETFGRVLAGTAYLVEFGAEWCTPCRAMTPVLDELAAELGDRAGVARVDITESADLAERYEVTSVPMLMIFVKGEPVRRIFGARRGRQLLQELADAGV